MSLPFDTRIVFDEIPDSRQNPQQQRYTVTGMTIRKRRAEPLGIQVAVNGKQILLWRRDDHVFATDALCPHQKANLALGDVEDLGGELCIVCPTHNWQFSLRSGRCRNTRHEETLSRYKCYVDEETGRVFVLFDSIDSSIFADTDF